MAGVHRTVNYNDTCRYLSPRRGHFSVLAADYYLRLGPGELVLTTIKVFILQVV